MLPPTVVVFDLDGTLIDSRGDIVAAVNHALIQLGRAPLPGQLVIRYVGDGARALCARAAQLPENNEEVDRLVELFLAYYIEHPVDFTRWAPGAQEALDALAQLPDMSLALCTNKARSATDVVLAALGIRTRFRAVVAGGDIREKKPAPGPLLHVAKLLGASPESMVMVGDGPQDIECAHRAKVRSVGVESIFGFRDRLLDARPDVFVRSLNELPEIINRWRDSTARMAIVPSTRSAAEEPAPAERGDPA